MRALFVGASFLALISSRLLAGESTPAFDVPRLDGITVDGKVDDWGARGFFVRTMPNEKGDLKPIADLDATFRLGWNDSGLLVLVDVRDDEADEAKTNELYERDSVEIFYAPRRGEPNVVQAVISPGVDPARPELRMTMVDERESESLKKIAATARAAGSKTPNGYILEVLLPWENLGITPEIGRELAFQLYVNDAEEGRRFQARWYPKGSGHSPLNLHRLRLSDKPSPAITARVNGEYERFRRIKIDVKTVTDLVGQNCIVKAGDRELAKAKLAEERGGRAGAKVVLPFPADDKGYGPLVVVVEGQAPMAVDLPDLEEARARAFMEEKLNFDPSVFPGPAFPKCEFAQPSYVEDLIGLYTISTAFYDANYNKVSSAKEPGRYGAVIEIKTEDGKIFRRMKTLFRLPQKAWWRNGDLTATIKLPKETGIDPAVTGQQKFSTDKYLKLLMGDSFSHESPDSATAAFLSAMYETKPGTPDATVFDDFLARDRQWWVGLKRKLAGADKAHPEPFVSPRINKDKPATVLHEGSLEAGMKPGAAEKIDAVLKEWSADSDEAFAVCVARHGVIILYKAYGQRDGKPMTVDTKSRMASITKAMSGAAMMMLVDQGLVNLDDPVAKYLPAFEGVSVPTPLTVRHLYTHTGGLEGHWGDDLNDFEDIVAGYYPHMAVGREHEYNGASIALGSKIVETVTGEALPQFYRRHLLDPLGCRHTDVTNSSWDAYSTPMDIAKFGQMLLNRGSYGDKTFMGEETFAQMLPAPLTKLLGPGINIEWGIGLTWFKLDGLSKRTFGHGAASSATLLIDPENDLVISMTRNNAGANFLKYHRKFLDTIVENLAE